MPYYSAVILMQCILRVLNFNEKGDKKKYDLYTVIDIPYSDILPIILNIENRNK